MPREYKHISQYEEELLKMKANGLIYRHKDKYSISEMCRLGQVIG